MLFAICVDTHSNIGPLIEQKLLETGHYPDTFEVNPVNDGPYFGEEPLSSIICRAMSYTRKMKLLYPKALCVGVASGIALYKTKTEQGLARQDIATMVERSSGGKSLYWVLNYSDAHWQLKNGVVRRKICEDSARVLCALLENACKKATIPKS
jgi:hypothetical protein